MKKFMVFLCFLTTALLAIWSVSLLMVAASNNDTSLLPYCFVLAIATWPTSYLGIIISETDW